MKVNICTLYNESKSRCKQVETMVCGFWIFLRAIISICLLHTQTVASQRSRWSSLVWVYEEDSESECFSWACQTAAPAPLHRGISIPGPSVDTAFPELTEAAALHPFSQRTTRGQGTALHLLHASQSTLCAVAYFGSSSLSLSFFFKLPSIQSWV